MPSAVSYLIRSIVLRQILDDLTHIRLVDWCAIDLSLRRHFGETAYSFVREVPALLGALAFLFIAGFSLQLIKLIE